MEFELLEEVGGERQVGRLETEVTTLPARASAPMYVRATRRGHYVKQRKTLCSGRDALESMHIEKVEIDTEFSIHIRLLC